MVLNYSLNVFFGWYYSWENEQFGVFAIEILFWIVAIKALNPEIAQNLLKANKTFCAAEEITEREVCLSKQYKEEGISALSP